MMAITPPTREKRTISTPTVSANSSRKKRILVVDDERDITESIRSALKDHFWVDIGGSSSQAINSYKPRFYDLILLDYRMPNVDGFAFYQQVKRIDPKVKICFITAYEDLHSRIANFNSHDRLSSIFPTDLSLPVLKKPFDKATLLATVSRLLGE